MGNVPSSTENDSTTNVIGNSADNGGTTKRRSKTKNKEGIVIEKYDTDTEDENNNISSNTGSTTTNNNNNIGTNNTNTNNNVINNYDDVTSRAQKALGININFREWQLGIVNNVRKFEDSDHPAATLLDSVCGPYLDPKEKVFSEEFDDDDMYDDNNNNKDNHHKKNNNNTKSTRHNNNKNNKKNNVRNIYSDENSEEDDSRTVSEDETTQATEYNNQRHESNSNSRGRDLKSKRSNNIKKENNIKDDQTVDSEYMSQSDYESTGENRKGSTPARKGKDGGRSSSTSNNNNNKAANDRASRRESSYETEDDETAAVSAFDDTTTVNDNDDNINNDNNKLGGGGKGSSSGSDNNNNKKNDNNKNNKLMSSTNNNNNNNLSSMLSKQPLASSFAKRCYFTKQGIGTSTQHYEGLTLTGNIVLMLATSMKLKGCPTICDEDLRRVEITYPNQFSRLPDELLLSSGWRRISKYCHFSNKPIPDGIPFFHSKQRLHVSGGYYFLLAAAVGMVRPMDVEPLTRDTLVLLETDYPNQCDVAPKILIQEPDEWTLVDRFCFFSGGPINTEEDVYYQADFDGNPIYMLAFLSPSLTPAELYKLDNGLLENGEENLEPGIKLISEVDEVESVYDLTDRDFDDLKLYHLGPCRALPQYILQPQAWTKVLPPHFLAAKDEALLRAQEYETQYGIITSSNITTTIPPHIMNNNIPNPNTHVGMMQVQGPLGSMQQHPSINIQQQKPHQMLPIVSNANIGRFAMDQQQQPHLHHSQAPVFLGPQQKAFMQRIATPTQMMNQQQPIHVQQQPLPHYRQHNNNIPSSHSIGIGSNMHPHQGNIRMDHQYYDRQQPDQYGQMMNQQHDQYNPMMNQQHEQFDQMNHQHDPRHDQYNQQINQHYEQYDQMGQNRDVMNQQDEHFDQMNQQHGVHYDQMNEHDEQYDHVNHQHEQFDQMNNQHTQYDQQHELYDNRSQRPEQYGPSQYNNIQHSGSYQQPISHINGIRHQQQPHPSAQIHQQLYDQIPPHSTKSQNPSNMHYSQHGPTRQQSWESSSRPQLEAINTHRVLLRDVEEEGAFINDMVAPLDEALASRASRSVTAYPSGLLTARSQKSQVDPPEDQPPSLSQFNKPLHPSGKHANSVFTSNYSVYSAEIMSQQQSSAFQEEEYYSSPEKSFGFREEFLSDGYENVEYQGEQYEQGEYHPDHDEDQQQQDGFQHENEDYRYDESQPGIHEKESFPHSPEADLYEEDLHVDTEGSYNEGIDLLSPVTDNNFTPSNASVSNFSIPISDGEFGSVGMTPTSNNSPRKGRPPPVEARFVESENKKESGLPPYSPRSGIGSEYSQSSALRGAQELLRRNRARRLSALSKQKDNENQDGDECEDPATPMSANTQTELESGTTWESHSEMTSVVTGSSAWTDNGENNPDRNSRRALILQMAKARMKSNKSASGTTPTSVQTKDDISPDFGTQKGSPSSAHLNDSDFDVEEEKKYEYRDTSSDINLIGDLD